MNHRYQRVPSVLRHLLLCAAIYTAVTANAQDDLTELTPSTAVKLLTSNGVWVLESVDLRPLVGSCAGKISLKFEPNHQVTFSKCDEGGISSFPGPWSVDSKDGALVLHMNNEESDLFLKDEGKAGKHEYHMRLNQYDARLIKGGMNLLHDYQFTPKRAYEAFHAK
jgi:hypothetical protein